MIDSVIESKVSLSKQTQQPNQWRYDLLRRGLYMLLFFAIYFVLELAIKALVIVHFIYRLISPTPQSWLLRFGSQLSLYMYQLWRYLTFNDEQRPWPFAPWPASESTQPPEHRVEKEISNPPDDTPAA